MGIVLIILVVVHFVVYLLLGSRIRKDKELTTGIVVSCLFLAIATVALELNWIRQM